MIMEQHLGVVMANDTDQEKRGGIKVRVDTLLHNFEYPDLFYPIFPPNMFKVPENGEVIEIIIIGDFDEDDPSEDGDLGTVEFSDYCFYTGKTFDVAEGVVPPELKINYPKRSGLFWNKDGTIIFYDATKNAKELTIALTDKKTVIQLKEDYVLVQQDQVKFEMQSGKIVMTDTGTEIGAAGANQPILLGTIVIQAFTSFFTAWQTEIATWAAVPPLDPGAVVYLANLATSITTLQATITNWPSGKHKVDQ